VFTLYSAAIGAMFATLDFVVAPRLPHVASVARVRVFHGCVACCHAPDFGATGLLQVTSTTGGATIHANRNIARITCGHDEAARAPHRSVQCTCIGFSATIAGVFHFRGGASSDDAGKCGRRPK
jgi:hypothetical protein